MKTYTTPYGMTFVVKNISTISPSFNLTSNFEVKCLSGQVVRVQCESDKHVEAERNRLLKLIEEEA